MPTLQMRKLRLGEESSGLMLPRQEVIEQDSDPLPGLLEGCMQVPGRDKKWWGQQQGPKIQRLWPLTESVPSSSQAAEAGSEWLEL